MTERRSRGVVAAPGAEILQWPADAELRRRLHEEGVPRLLVLEAGQVPPAPLDEREDWIWVPTDERDLFSRLRRLAEREAPASLAPGSVNVGEGGMAWIAGHVLPLPPAEAGILRLLSDPPERLRTRSELQTAAWGDVPHERRSLDSRVFVLRRRLRPHGLAIQAVRGRGFVLTVAGSGGPR